MYFCSGNRTGLNSAQNQAAILKEWNNINNICFVDSSASYKSRIKIRRFFGIPIHYKNDFKLTSPRWSQNYYYWNLKFEIFSLSLSLSLSLPVCLCVSLSLCPLCLSLSLSMSLSVYVSLSMCASVCVCLSLRLSLCLSLRVSLSVSLSMCLR